MLTVAIPAVTIVLTGTIDIVVVDTDADNVAGYVSGAVASMIYNLLPITLNDRIMCTNYYMEKVVITLILFLIHQ